jgi:hypothetical protein
MKIGELVEALVLFHLKNGHDFRGKTVIRGRVFLFENEKRMTVKSVIVNSNHAAITITLSMVGFSTLTIYDLKYGEAEMTDNVVLLKNGRWSFLLEDFVEHHLREKKKIEEHYEKTAYSTSPSLVPKPLKEKDLVKDYQNHF